MSKITTAINQLKHNRGEFFASILMYLNFLFPDKLYLSLLFRCKMGYWMDWKNPKTFSEKLQWLKLYNRKPEYTQMVDKYAAKEYVAKIIGQEYIIPTLGVWDSPKEIDWNSLPQKFVLKTTHGGGNAGVIICKDKSTIDVKTIKKQLSKAMRQNIYMESREWPYKNVDKRIIAETFIEVPYSVRDNTDLPDYKFYCFNGKPVYCQVIRDRRNKETIDFYDMEWNHMPFVGLNPIAGNGKTHVEKPIYLCEMIEICRNLSKGIPYSRIDLYIIEEKIFFGEITFFPYSGMGAFSPSEWNEKLGDIIKLPVEN